MMLIIRPSVGSWGDLFLGLPQYHTTPFEQPRRPRKQLNAPLFPRRKRVFLDDLPAAKRMGLYKLCLCHLQMILSEHSKSESLQIMILHRIFRYFEATHDFQMFLKFLDATHEFLAFSHHVPEFFHHICGSLHHFAALL